jgi:hypothetical protein
MAATEDRSRQIDSGPSFPLIIEQILILRFTTFFVFAVFCGAINGQNRLDFGIKTR